jgi:hypothetical protein
MEGTDAGIEGDRASTGMSERTRRQHSRRETTEEPAAMETTLAAPSPTSDAKPRLLRILENIDMKLVEAHFSKFDKDGEGDVNEDVEGGAVNVKEGEDINEDDEQGGCEPYLVTDEFVSQDDLREYCEHSSYRDSPFSLRFLELSDDGKLWIVELPSEVHESSVENINLELFFRQSVLRDYCHVLGTTTIHLNSISMEADKTYGPLPNVPNSVPPPGFQGRWVTFVLEVGRSQRGLRWYNYTGMQYVLLIGISPKARIMSYEFYEVNLTRDCRNSTTASGGRIRFYSAHSGGSNSGAHYNGQPSHFGLSSRSTPTCLSCQCYSGSPQSFESSQACAWLMS